MGVFAKHSCPVSPPRCVHCDDDHGVFAVVVVVTMIGVVVFLVAVVIVVASIVVAIGIVV